MRLPACLVLVACLASAQQYRAFWADAFHSGYKSPAEVDTLVENLARARANAVFMQVRRRADSYYTRTLEVPAQDPAYTSSFDALQYLIERAHARGIEVHAWFNVYPLWSGAPPANPDHLWHQHGPRAPGEDMWMNIYANGGVSDALDPGHPAVQNYLANVILDPIPYYDLDGIHLDYIRYAEGDTVTGRSGYNPLSVSRFQRQELRAGTPLANDAAWGDFRRRQVTQFVRQIYLRAIEKKPSLKVTAALISWGNGPANDAGFRGTDAYATVFQDWRSWLEEGILDLGMPMHYFRDTANASFLDRWLSFAKDRSYGRAYLPGLAPYLNSIPESMSQLVRTLAPSDSGKMPLGVCFYSYASTNTLNAAGNPITPNEEFYRQVGDYFAAPVTPPVLTWKISSKLGHIVGSFLVDGGPAWLNDHATIVIRHGGDTGETVTSGAGSFGFVDLDPGLYALTVLRGSSVVFTATPQDVRAGAVTRFDIRLKADDLGAALPRITRIEGNQAAPGDIITLEGSLIGRATQYAASVPLPGVLGQTQVLVNGAATPLFSVSPEQIILQLPYQRAETWEIMVRHSGMESAAVSLNWVAARPVVTGVARVGARSLEIYATGLGLVDPGIPPGAGADPNFTLPRVVLPVRVLINDSVTLQPLYAGLQLYQPGRYLINLELPEGLSSGSLRLLAGDAVSNPVSF